MNYFKYRAFLREFPFLDECITDQFCNASNGDITVARLGKDALALKPTATYYNYAYSSEQRKTIDFVLKDGSVLQDAVKVDSYSEGYRERTHHTGESILEAVERHRIEDVLSFVVAVEIDIDDNPERAECSWVATVYKVARGESVASELAKARAAARKEVEVAAAF